MSNFFKILILTLELRVFGNDFTTTTIELGVFSIQTLS